jgi:hypothetical protein
MERENGLRLVEKIPSALKSFPYFDHTGAERSSSMNCPKCQGEMQQGFVAIFPWVGSYWYEVLFEGSRRRPFNPKSRRVV